MSEEVTAPDHGATMARFRHLLDSTPSFPNSALLREIVEHLDARAAADGSGAGASGALIYEGASLRAALPRTGLTEKLAQVYVRDLFYERPVEQFLQVWSYGALELPESTAISEAIERALGRAMNQRFDPIVIRTAGGERFLLDVYNLLNEQCVLLSETLNALAQQTDARRQAEREREQMYQRLLTASRQAGMAEVATGILHNVGNVLNSVHISAQLIHDRLKRSKIPNVGKATALLNEHEGKLGRFLTEDERGRQLPSYLTKLAGHLDEEQRTLMDEIGTVQQSVDHIAQIISSQQSYAKGAQTREWVDLSSVLNDAIQINSVSLQRHNIEVERDDQPVPEVYTDKHMLMQVIVNLINNARLAIRDAAGTERRLAVWLDKLDRADESAVRIRISDTGVGIRSENLGQIFQHGFTTREDGHGFGLHNAANAVKQMQGTLTAHSDGPGRGATFTLTLPVTPANRGAEREEAIAAPQE